MWKQHGGVRIGNDVSIAHCVTIIATSHDYSFAEKTIRDNELIQKEVKIEDNVWIGAKATILCGRTIAQGCVIGAGTVVTTNTDENGVYAGVPNSLIKKR